MLETIETSLYLLEYQIQNSIVAIKQKFGKKKKQPIFDSKILEAYK